MAKGNNRAGLRVVRWSGLLFEFDYDLNQVADCVSILPLSDAVENSDSTVEFVAAIRGLHRL